MQRSYYAIIPANVRYDKDLTPNAKLLYGEITALCNERGYCWASNQYFADLYGVSKTSITDWINQLIKKRYISRTIKYKEGTKEILGRYLRIVNDPTQENLSTPTQENLRENNTVFNNTVNNTKKILSYLNSKADKNFKHTSKKTKDLIKARFNEGFTVKDFYKVIDIKVAEWKDDPKMEKYLRPETLFSNKFEGYLNQKHKESEEDKLLQQIREIRGDD